MSIIGQCISSLNAFVNNGMARLSPGGLVIANLLPGRRLVNKMFELWVSDSHDRYMNEAGAWAKMVGWSSERASGFLGPKLRFFRP